MDKIEEYINKCISGLNIGDYIGIIAYGSYITESNNNLSDLDIMIIKKDYDTSDIGSIMIDGVRIEYFIQGLKNLYESTRKEVCNNDPSHLTKFATCKIVYDKTGETGEFIEDAKRLYSIKIEQSFDENDRFEIFSINNRLEDLSTLLDDKSFYAVYFVTLERIRSAYCKINGFISLPLTKIENIYSDEDYAKKYISSEIHTLPDEEFINLYLQCLEVEDKAIMYDRINKLYSYSFGVYDFDPNNFHLKFKKPPFRV